MSKYKVLWFDDEWDELEEISEEALDFDIELQGVSNAEEGISLLESSKMEFDAVLLDGKFYSNAKQTKGAETDNAFGRVVKFLESKIKTDDFLPWFILSGQTSFVKDNHSLVELFKDSAKEWQGDKVFDKNDDDDTPELFSRLVKTIKGTDSFKIKSQYAEVFDVIKLGFLSKEQEPILLSAIRKMENTHKIDNSITLFNPLRMLIERVQEKLVEIGLVPSELSFNGLQYFIPMTHKDYDFNGVIAPPIIGHLFKGIIPVLQEASHSKEDMRLGFEKYVIDSERSFLYRSTTFQVLEILLWFKRFIIENPHREVNKLLWSLKEINSDLDLKGELKQDDNGNYYVNNFIFSYLNIHDKYEVGCQLEITNYIENNKKATQDLYPYFATKFKELK